MISRQDLGSLGLNTDKLAGWTPSPRLGVLFQAVSLSCCLYSYCSTIPCDGLFVWTFSVCYLVLYTLVWSPKSWLSLCSTWSCECPPPAHNLALFSVLASNLKHSRLYSNPADSGVRLNSLWCLSCSCCLGHLTTGELN